MYVIVGANGFLGSYIIQTILSEYDDEILAVSDREGGLPEDRRVTSFICDISDRARVKELKEKIEGCRELVKIIYLAAYHNPDLVDQNPKLAWKINIISLAYFINEIRNVKCLFYPSTDSVYGESGDDRHFREGDCLNPVNLYGKHKALAEKMITTYGYNIVRFPFLIGPSLLDYKLHFYDQIADSIMSGKEIEMYKDSLRSSLDFKTASELLLRLAESHDENMPQIINVSGDEDLSKYEIGLRIADKLHVSRELIVPVSISTCSGIFKTPRASSTLLDNQRLKQLLGIKEIHINI